MFQTLVRPSHLAKLYGFALHADGNLQSTVMVMGNLNQKEMSGT